MKAERKRHEDADFAGLMAACEWAEFKRQMGEVYSVSGYLLQASAEWLLIHASEDFHLDGYRLIRARDITRVRHSNRGFQRILQREGIAQRVGIGSSLNIATLESILRDIKRKDEIAILEFEYGGDDYLHIGKPVRVGRRACTFRHFNTNGVWDLDVISIDYEDVSTIQLRCEYINVYARYVREPQRGKNRKANREDAP